MNRRIRETSHLQHEEAFGWSDWIWAMVPVDTERKNNLERRGDGQDGYKNKNLRERIEQAAQAKQWVDNLCGIYEWRVTKFEGTDPRVVYVGSTCPRSRSPRQSMRNRIVAYTTNGNHKRELINEALRRGYELWVRFKLTKDENEAMAMEDALLARYDYAWNIRNNDVRPILAEAEKWE